MTELIVYESQSSLARGAAELFVILATEAISSRGLFTVALSGGSTPRTTYQLLATDDLAPRVDWQSVHVFWGDERCVPPDHPDSNFRMACSALLENVPIPAANIHRIHGEVPPDEASRGYEAELQATLGPLHKVSGSDGLSAHTQRMGAGGRFDLVFLGMGADGHTASLFPGTAALDEQESLAVPVYVEELCTWRVTLTLPVFNAARHVVFLVSGEGKAVALSRIRAGELLPARIVQPDPGRLIWLVDREADRG